MFNIAEMLRSNCILENNTSKRLHVYNASGNVLNVIYNMFFNAVFP
jgi:hypothetical protein